MDEAAGRVSQLESDSVHFTTSEGRSLPFVAPRVLRPGSKAKLGYGKGHPMGTRWQASHLPHYTERPMARRTETRDYAGA